YFLPGKPSVLLAEGLAERLRIQLGDTLYLIGQGYHASTAAGKYTVAGIVKFGSPEINRGSLFLPVQDAQNLFSCPERLTSLVIMLEDNQQLQEAKQALTRLLPNNYEVMTWEEMLPEVKQHIETDSNNMRYVQFILYLLICFGIFGTLLMMMMERKYEMGMLVAIGMKKNLLAIVVTLESLFTVIVGCLLGLLASAPLVAYFHLHPIRMGGTTAKAYERFGFEAIFPTSTDPRLFWEQGLTVLVLGLVLSLYPVYKVFRIEPVTSMKR
ncbi:MAG: ABC transporter permease, partial [Chitinophagaceae bacterium]